MTIKRVKITNPYTVTFILLKNMLTGVYRSAPGCSVNTLSWRNVYNYSFIDIICFLDLKVNAYSSWTLLMKHDEYDFSEQRNTLLSNQYNFDFLTPYHEQMCSIILY